MLWPPPFPLLQRGRLRKPNPDSKYPDSKYPATQCQSVFEKSDDLVMAVALVIPRQRAVTGNMPSGELILITLWTKLYSPGHDGSHGSTMCCH
jgi:hypothetical protein